MLYVAFHLTGVWPVHVGRSVTIRASALAGMTDIKGHGKCRRAPRRMTGVMMLLDTLQMCIAHGMLPDTCNFHGLRTEWTAEVLSE